MMLNPRSVDDGVWQTWPGHGAVDVEEESMATRKTQDIEARPSAWHHLHRGWWVLVIASMAVIAAIDWIAPIPTTISLLYLFPILLSSVMAGWRGGLAAACL